MGKREAQRCDFTALDGAGQRLRALRHIEALLHQRQHALAQIRQMRELTLAPKQVAAEFLLKLLDGASERGLRDMTLFSRAREIQRACGRQEVADLMHFHSIRPAFTKANIRKNLRKDTSLHENFTTPQRQFGLAMMTFGSSGATRRSPRQRHDAAFIAL